MNTGDYFEAPLNLTPAEGLALYAGAAALAALPEMSQADALQRALAKLGRALGVGDRADAGGIKLQLQGGPPEHLEALQGSLRDRRRISMEYRSAASGRLTRREVEPWGLVTALGRWYLVGWDRLRSDERMFRTDRIKSVTVTDVPAEVPEDLDLERYKGGFVGGAEERRVQLEISPAVARWFDDYYPVESSRELADGWRAVELISGSDGWAATLVLRLGDQVRSVRPDSVVQTARALASAIADRHSQAPH